MHRNHNHDPENVDKHDPFNMQRYEKHWLQLLKLTERNNHKIHECKEPPCSLN